MTLDEMLKAGTEYYTRGDAMGLYRFVRQKIAEATDPHDEGIARAVYAEVLVRWHLASRTTIESELVRARLLLRPYPEDLAYLLFLHLVWRLGEDDLAGVQVLRTAYERLCVCHPCSAGVWRWQGRLSTWMGRLALTQGDLDEARKQFERSLLEFEQYEPDPGSRGQLIRSTKLRLADLALRKNNLLEARRHLDDCEGSTISRSWETLRACTEVKYAILTDNAERARFWLRLAQSWATPQNEIAAVLTLTQARVCYAFGEAQKARLLTIEARRLAAQHKQDQLLPEIREFFREQASGTDAGQFVKGGIPRVEAYGSLANSRSGLVSRSRTRH